MSPKVNVDIGDILSKSAQSTLGILALSCIIIAFIAYAFFKNAGDRVKLMVFVMIFCGAVGFGVQVLVQKNKSDQNTDQRKTAGEEKIDGNSASAAALSPPPLPSPDKSKATTAPPKRSEETIPKESDQADSPEGLANQTVFIDRVTRLGTEDPSCQKEDRFRGRLVSGIVYNPIEIPPPYSKCYVRLHFDIQETSKFKAPFEITFFNSDESGNGNQILSATINKLPNKFQINLGRINIDGITAYIYQPGTTSSEADKRAPTVVGNVELSY